MRPHRAALRTTPPPQRRGASHAGTLLLLVVLVSAACTWYAPQGDLAGTGHNPVEQVIVPSALAGLVERWQAPLAPGSATPVAAGNTVIVATDHGVSAFAAAGCGQPVCSPIWQDADPGVWFGQPTTDGDLVYVPRGGVLAAYDLEPGVACGGAPTTCAPRWTGSDQVSWVIAGNGVVVGTGAFDAAYVYAMGDGSECPGGVCAPSKVLAMPMCGLLLGCSTSLASMDDGLVVLGTDEQEEIGHNGKVVAFDLDVCAAAPPGPDRCEPAWVAYTRGVVRAPVIADGAVFADGMGYWYDPDEFEYEFREHRVSRLTLDGSVDWTWSDEAIDRGVLAYAAGSLFGANRNTVRSFDAADGSIEWTAGLPAGAGGISIAAGVVYVGTTAGTLAFDAAGVTGCSGPPTTCTPLATLPAAASGTSPVPTNGLVLVAGADDTLHAFGLD